MAAERPHPGGPQGGTIPGLAPRYHSSSNKLFSAPQLAPKSRSAIFLRLYDHQSKSSWGSVKMT